MSAPDKRKDDTLVTDDGHISKRMRTESPTDSAPVAQLSPLIPTAPAEDQTGGQTRDQTPAKALNAALTAGEWTNSDTRATVTSLRDATSAYIDTRQDAQVRSCPYLDTINRSLLDFDFEKVCSVTLQPHNLYCCLVCGKYFQGRGRASPAYEHSLDPGHAVFMHMHTGRVYCLPDNYEVVDTSLADIRHYLSPTYTPALIRRLASDPTLGGLTSFGERYLPGFIGISDLGATGWVSAALRALLSIAPLRAVLLQPQLYAHSTQPVLVALGELTRRLWWPHLLRPQVSPHELVQACASESRGRFAIGKSADAGAFLMWLLHTLTRALTAPPPAARPNAAAASASRTSAAAAAAPTPASAAAAAVQCVQGVVLARSAEGEGESRLPASVLTLALPPMPVFSKHHATYNPHAAGAAARAASALPQVSLKQLLAKFDGTTVTAAPPAAAAASTPVATAAATSTTAAAVKAVPPPRTDATAPSPPLPPNVRRPPLPASHARTLSLATLPAYLLLHTPRRSVGEFGEEWNRTLVTAPLRGLDMSPYCSDDPANGHANGHVNGDAEAAVEEPADGLGSEASRRALGVSALREVARKCEWQWRRWEEERARMEGTPASAPAPPVKAERESASQGQSASTEEDFLTVARSVGASVEKPELQAAVSRLVDMVRERRRARSVYDLVCQVCEEREPKDAKVDGRARYYAFALHEPSGRWYRLEDLQVRHDETTAQQIALSPSLVKVYKRRQH